MKLEKLILNNKLDTNHVGPNEIGRAKRIDDAAGRYIEFAKSSVNNISLSGLKIVVDCANGAAYKVAPLILRELGADVIILNNNPNGNNINLDSGSLHPEIARAAVLGHDADAGISLDGDADRIAMVDSKGNYIL